MEQLDLIRRRLRRLHRQLNPPQKATPNLPDDEESFYRGLIEGKFHPADVDGRDLRRRNWMATFAAVLLMRLESK